MPRREFTSAHYNERTQLRCDGCDWSGAAGAASERRRPDFVAVRCPGCDRTIATVVPEPPEPRSAAGASYDFDDERLTCASCGWSGRGREWSTEMNRGMDLFDVYCPKCDAREGFRSFPTHGQIRDAAAAGDPRAAAELPELDRREAFLDRAVSSLLREPADLPDIEGDELELVWDFSSREGGDAETVIRHGERELWRETAFWEGGDRFAQVFTILRRRYGWRLVSLIPTDESLGYLGGDHFTDDYRRAEHGLTNLEPVQRGPVKLTLGSVTDSRGRRFHVLRQGELVVWRGPEASGEPTSADAERLEEWVNSKYRTRVEVTLAARASRVLRERARGSGSEGGENIVMSEDSWRPGARFSEALAYAVHKHADQRRRGSETPYIAHLLGVCALVIEDGGSEDEAIAALLHDAAEDQGGEATLEEIEDKFGLEVRRIVAACSDTFVTPKPPSQQRKAAYIEGIADKHPDELRVSLADKVHNARSILFDYRAIGERVFDRFNVDREETLKYYRRLGEEFAEHGAGPMADELMRVVEELEAAVA